MPKKKEVTIARIDPSTLATRLRVPTPPFHGKWDLRDPGLNICAIAIQRIIRGLLGKLRFDRQRRRVHAAIKIQRRMRGFLCRVSDRFILAQVYLRLPSFWKEIMKSGVPKEEHIELNNDAQIVAFLGKDLKIGKDVDEDAAKKKKKKTKKVRGDDVFGSKVRDLRQSVEIALGREPTELHSNIGGTILDAPSLKDVQKSTRELAPKLPFIVPQPFDKSPYVSLTDGRKMTFYSHHDSLFKAADRNHANPNDIHQFHIVYWPHTEPVPVVDNSITEHDPHLNSFEIIHNFRHALHCQVCDARLRIVQCFTCCKGYCFFCAFRVHTDPSRRLHEMSITEPRVELQNRASRSLVYHIDQAQHISYDLRYVVKYLRSAKEVLRLQEEKRLAKEYEAEEERRRMEFLKAESEAIERHTASTTICLLYRKAKAKQIVITKRHQLNLEKVLAASVNYERLWIPVQRLVRAFITRRWFAKRGVVFKIARKRKKKRIAKLEGQDARITYPEICSRVDFELRQRLFNKRRSLISALYEKHLFITTTLTVNIEYWLKQYYMLEPTIERLQKEKDLYEHKYTKISEALASISSITDTKMKEATDKEQKLIFCNVNITELRLESIRNIQWWIAQYLRLCYRRLRIVEARFLDLCDQLTWIAKEAFVVNQVRTQLEVRMQNLPDKYVKHMVAWTERFLEGNVLHAVSIDAQQESVLQEELDRLQRDELVVMETDSLLEELRTALVADAQYAAERVSLDKLAIITPAGTEEAVNVASKIMQLKRKQQQLNNSVIDSIKVGLEVKFNAEEEEMVRIAAFPTDRVELKVNEMHEITAELLNKHTSHRNFKMGDFYAIFVAQPWIVVEAVEDVRLEEEIKTMELELDKVLTEINGIQARADEAAEELEALDKKITELNREIEIRATFSGVGEELSEERNERLMLLDVFKRELMNRTAERVISIKLNETNAEAAKPTQDKQVQLEEDLIRKKDRLDLRRKERIVIAAAFFDYEDSWTQRIEKTRLTEKEEIINNISKIKAALTFCDLYSDAPCSYLEQILKQNLSIKDCENLGITFKTPKFAILDKYTHLRPRVIPMAADVMKKQVFIRKHTLEVTTKCYEDCIDLLKTEMEFMQTYHSKRKVFEERIATFLEHQLFERRQKALKKEFEVRKVRLKELREIRVANMRAKKEAEKKAAEDKEKKKRPPMKPLTQQLKEFTRYAVRGIKDAIRDYRHKSDVAMDPEEQRMAGTIMERSKVGAGNRAEGIRFLQFTGDDAEEASFQAQNDLLKEKGLPHFVKNKKGLSTGLYLWSQKSYDGSQFITSLELHHKDPHNEFYKNPALAEDEGYELVQHPKTNMVIWLQRDKTKISAIADVDIAFDSIQENHLLHDGYMRIDHMLSDFDLPETSFWFKKTEKIQVSSVANTNTVIKEFKNTRRMLKEMPYDKNLQALFQRLKTQLENAYDREVAAQVTDPLKWAIDLMALDASDLDMWVQCYQKLDTSKHADSAVPLEEGLVTMDNIFSFLEETPLGPSKEIFYSMDAVNDEGHIEFGDFVRAVGSYCFFGEIEVCKFLYVYADKAKEGHIIHEQFIKLINDLNPFDKKAARRALKEIQLVPGKKMTFGEFFSINKKFPTLMYPAFRFQHTLKEKFLGVDWWFNKLTKYKAVRRKLAAGSANTDELANTEIARYREDQAREQRIKERAVEIKKETNPIKKVLLQARQFVDEVS